MRCGHAYSAWKWLSPGGRLVVAEIGRAYPTDTYRDARSIHREFVAKGPPRMGCPGRWVEIFRYKEF